jgi:hypothetical protein
MEPQKAFVREDGTTILKCPHCRHARTVSVDKLKDKKKVLKIKCSCQQSYTVSLELRKMYRKDTNLDGNFVNLSLDNARGVMIVKDVSMGGIGFTVIGRNTIQPGHELEVTFTLDDANHSVISKQVMVRVVRDKFVGCEFKHAHEYDKSLGFYLMP